MDQRRSSSWGVVPLKHLATLANGYVFDSASWEDAGVPIIRIENLNGSLSFNYSNSDPGEKYRVRQGDPLLRGRETRGRPLGAARWNLPGLHLLNQHIFKVSTFGCDKNWLYWSLRAATRWIERELTSGMIGMVHVTKEELANVLIPLPPIDEQRRIVDFIESEDCVSRFLTLRRVRGRFGWLPAGRDPCQVGDGTRRFANGIASGGVGMRRR